VDLHVDPLNLPVEGATTFAVVLRHQSETQEELVSPGIMVAFVSGNVWVRIDAGYRQGTALEQGAQDYVKRAVPGALGAAGG
jgi:hypothetical protein